MDIYRHPQTNLDLPPPTDWDAAVDGQCETLPVIEGEDGGRSAMLSFWRPSKEDLALLNAGHPITLLVHADTPEQHPVVSVGVADMPCT